MPAPAVPEPSGPPAAGAPAAPSPVPDSSLAQRIRRVFPYIAHVRRYWIVVLIAGAAMIAVTVALARASARTPTGEAARKAAVVLSAIWIAIFLWETASVGAGAFGGPFELAWAAWKG